MKIVLQRVLEASVKVEEEFIGEIGKGFLLFLGIEATDTEKEIAYLIQKILKLRVFENELGKLDYSITDVNGALLVVSQFTLCGSVKKGNRPSFTAAKNPVEAEQLYLLFIEQLKKETTLKVASGKFGATMKVGLINDGPFTLLIETPI